MKKREVIFFDIDDTLLDNAGAERAAAKLFQSTYKGIFPVSPDDFADNWRRITEKHVQRYLSGEISFQGQRRERLKELFAHHRGLSDHEADEIFEEYLQYYEGSWTLFDDVKTCLSRFHGSQLGIISNGSSIQQRQKLSATGILEYFSVIVISEDIGISKPDPRIFRHACHLANETPSQCRHIGDNISADVHGSISAGLHGIWLNRNGRQACKAITTIASLSGLEFDALCIDKQLLC